MSIPQLLNSRTLSEKIAVVCIDAILLSLSLFLTYLVRFDFNISSAYIHQFFLLVPVVLSIRIPVLYHLYIYRRSWLNTGLDDLSTLIKGLLLGSFIFLFVDFLRSNSLAVIVSIVLLSSVLLQRFLLHNIARRKKTYITLIIVSSFCFVLLGIVIFSVLSKSSELTSDIPIIGQIILEQNKKALVIPRSVIFLELTLSLLILGGARVMPRILQNHNFQQTNTRKKVLIWGAGELGILLSRHIRTTHQTPYEVVGFVDDDPLKAKMVINGLTVLGDTSTIGEHIEKTEAEEILVAISGLSEKKIKSVGTISHDHNVPLRKVPSIQSILIGDSGVLQFEPIDPTKLLERSEIKLDSKVVLELIENKTVLVTGAGGSIGSELCRQIAQCQPSQLLLLGKGENSIYLIQKELEQSFPELNYQCVIGDIRDRNRIDFVMRNYRPQLVFHAAAHKHVPFMEENPEESVLNNVFGTKNLCELASEYGVESFVMISTDKAVVLSSVMGATKRLAELALQEVSKDSKTKFVVVRFGNVLGSRGSVVPLFEKQIRAGGPVTVTHPDMTRYFMSIPEAVSLVLHSGSIAQNGDLCLLDMGEPVRIVKLAENMIRLHGKEPYTDIDVVFTGIRPGETLNEQLFHDEENKVTKKDGKISISPAADRISKTGTIPWETLYKTATEQNSEELVKSIKEILPRFRS